MIDNGLLGRKIPVSLHTVIEPRELSLVYIVV